MDEEGDGYPSRWRLFGVFSGKVKFHMVTSMADHSLTGEADALRRNRQSYSTQAHAVRHGLSGFDSRLDLQLGLAGYGR